jgi:protein TonB
MPKGTRTSATVTPLITARKKPVTRPRALVVHTEARTMSLPFLFADATPGKRLLFKAIVGSVLLHLALLAVHFSPLDLAKFDRDGPPLEIALVNAKSMSKPTKAELLAQAHLDGGGNTDANRRAKSPLPVLPKESASNQLATATQKVDTLEQRASEMMAQLKAAAPVAVPQSKPNEMPERNDLPTATEQMQRTLESMRLEAQIAKDMDAYQKRPKRRFIGARAEEYRFARYVEDWRLKVERIGNLNYPEAARSQKLYGSLLLTTGIRADGSIESIVVERSSGKRVLDLAAAHIVQMGGPYSPFPPDIRRDTDILYITRTWTFAPGDSLTSQ